MAPRSFMSREIVQAIRDPALQGRWVAAVIDSLGKSVLTPPDFIIESINPSFTSVSSTSRFYGGQAFSFTASASTPPISLNFYETHDYVVTEWLNNWRLSIYDPDTEDYGLPSEYMRTIIVDMFPIYTSEAPAARLILERCWPSDPQAMDLTYANIEGRLTVVTTINVGRVEFKRP